MKGKCKKCKKNKILTKHSLIGGHRPPFQMVCRKCHDEIHGMRKRPESPGKYQPGTPKYKRKKI